MQAHVHVDASCKAISVLACSFRHPPQVSMGIQPGCQTTCRADFSEAEKVFQVRSYNHQLQGYSSGAYPQSRPAVCIDQMVNTVWPGSLSRSVPQIWSAIHALVAQCPAHLDLELLNDDLVGFFNSVPEVRILEAVDMLVRMFRTSFSDVQLSVCINER